MEHFQTMNDSAPTLVLASTSPFRKALLQRLGIPFETVSPDVDETARYGESPHALVTRLSEAKAIAGAASFDNALVIGSDQLAVCNDDVLGKPGNYEKAFEQLECLSGNRVSFLTGLCLYNSQTGACQLDLVAYHVVFRELGSGQIDRYLKAEQPYNCAGSFKSEGLGISLFESMQGDDPNALIGLPLIRLVTWLNEAGIAIP